MNFIGKKEYPDFTPGASKYLSLDVTVFLPTSVTLSSAVWSSEPVGLTFTSQTDTTTKTTALVTAPTSPATEYNVKIALTFSDGTSDTACAPIKMVCN